jgi:DNA-binding transcriptional MerR regulator
MGVSEDTLPMFPDLEPASADAPSDTEPAGEAAAAGGERRPRTPAERRRRRGADGHAPERPVAQREYYSIGEVCELTGLKSHVLRYWESQFPELNPSKNRSGNRVYQRKEIRLILLVKDLLYGEKYTIEGARQKLETLRKGGELHAQAARAFSEGLAHEIRTGLEEVLDLLTLPEES